MRYFLMLLLSGLIFSCTNKNDLPTGILKPKQMQDVFWDYIRANTYTTQFGVLDSSKKPAIENLKMQEKIFKLHHITRETFYKSYTYYSNHKELMTTMLDSIIARNEREKISIKPVSKSL